MSTLMNDNPPIQIKIKPKNSRKKMIVVEDKDLKTEYIDNHCDAPGNKEEEKNCNKFLLKKELIERKQLGTGTGTESKEGEGEGEGEQDYLYPNLNDANFIIKIAEKKEFSDTKYDGHIYNIKDHADTLSKADYELSPHQMFVRNFLSFQTPYNSLLLYHGLGTGKTCSAIGVCEEQRDYLKQMGIPKRIIIVASPNVQDNFRLQLFDERKLKLVDGLWNIRACTGNKLLTEINPMNMKGLTREKIISQIKNLINNSYLFLGYIEFANYIEKIEQVKGEIKNPKDKEMKRMRNLKYEFNNRLIVIDEVHNIRIADDNENKKVAERLLNLVKSADNLRLLLLSATPMYNSYKEIIWLLNLMNINDRRATVDIKDIFDKDGNFKTGNEDGKELLIRKATGYISFVRGENPYTFPFRVYPSLFANENTLENVANKYPEYQMNGKKINAEDTIDILKSNIFLTKIGSEQMKGYNIIIDTLRKKKFSTSTAKGVVRDMPNFENMESFGYTLLQVPLEALNIVYPIQGLERPEVEGDGERGNSEGDSRRSLDEILRLSPSASDRSKIVDDIVPNPAVNPIVNPVPNPVPELDPILELGNEVIELTKKTSSEPSVSSYEFEPVVVKKGGENSTSDEETHYINANDLTGHKGLERMMDFVDSKTPPEKGSFEYKSSTIKDYKRIFSKDNIGKYSSKIENICNSIVNKSGEVSKGIILIYSQYIDGGLIPIALALEEMGITRYGQNAKSLFKTPPTDPVDSRTMKPRVAGSKDFLPAKYILITGDPRISINNDIEVKAVTSDGNEEGNKIKIVLISKAGSEGVDFKFIRQIHIMEPWYNMNRIEQIIGRGVRNFSHKDLPFEERNVQLFLYGTILENNTEESADLYVYRVAEYKAIQIGEVSRILKQTAVDCIINREQINFTQTNIENEYKKKNINEKIVQHLSTGMKIEDFKVGDEPNSATCDYMSTCEYKCYPDKTIQKEDIKEHTYNEAFIMMNSEKLLQKIRMLFKDRFFYKKKDLLDRIDTPKPYPRVQTYAALTQLIENRNESISDRYGRTGYLINIDEYYLFQPSELNDTKISMFERSVPIDFKNNFIEMNMEAEPNSEINTKVLDKNGNISNSNSIRKEIKKNKSEGKKREEGLEGLEEDDLEDDDLEEEEEESEEEKARRARVLKMKNESKVMNVLKENFDIAVNTSNSSDKINRGVENWYKHCGVTMRKMIKEYSDPNKNKTEEEILLFKSDILDFLVEHLVDMTMYAEKLEILNYIFSKEVIVEKSFESRVKKYLDKKIIKSRSLTGIILYSGTTRTVLILHGNRWVDAESEDVIDLSAEIKQKYKIETSDFNKIVGFIGYENKNKYLVFKVKDTQAKRNTGARCDESSKTHKLKILNELAGPDENGKLKYTKESTRGIVQAELCSLQEFLFRYNNKIKKNGKIYFLDFETSMIYNF